jgi:lysophospholipase L1-like esterase
LGRFLDDPRWGQCLEPDGIHLNSEGHRRIHQALASWPALLDWAGLSSLALATPLA